MTDVHQLKAEAKDRAGKGAARAARRAGRTPAVIYGAKKDPVMITVDPLDLRREISTGAFFATLFDVQVNGKAERVLPRDLQLHPVTDRPLHVDFLRVSATTEIEVDVPVEFINEEESPGLKRGGVLNIVRHAVEVSCRADSIPQEFVIDLTGLDIGDSVHISNITLPEGVTPTITDRDFTICTIAAPNLAVEEEEADEEAEGEVPEGEEPVEGEGEDEEKSEPTEE